MDVIEGETLPELRCDADALPSATYRWISDSFYDKFSGVIAEGPVLALNRSITRDSAGTYTCLAANRHGERRIDLQINVLFAPTCTIYESRSPTVSVSGVNSKNVALVCEASHANPMSHLEFVWSLNGTHLNDSYIQQIATIEDNKSRIIIPASIEELFGTWTCSIRNTVGTSDPNCTLFVDAPLCKFFLHFSLHFCSSKFCNKNVENFVAFFSVVFVLCSLNKLLNYDSYWVFLTI